jgi:hypothetical protein
MPTYFNAMSVNSILGSGSLQYINGSTIDIPINDSNNDIINNNNNNNNNNCCCPSTTTFFETLVNKLEEMVISLKVQFSELKTVIPPSNRPNKALVIAEATVSAVPFIVRQEYMLYMQRFGPPQSGIFDETLLAGLRKELGL